ncbi:hypothetical protein [Thalassovita mediterranea]|jgi:hypothetical protein|uniref:Type IV pilus biogenesis n=1 Tax=Thalassovita mediterranea TaxID=340021 RepID=A0A0P1H6Q5_9RHOB|nr:hypothetical protein [Thalassovita mediterranea]MCG7572254.1 hypothetical protein [Phaeobacter sp. CNT1-3]CUH85583.1 hypothetical protein TM5383_02817 [Thalassovita mediterranea]SIS30143.1 hypothetical protein SAMN05421685_102233 [Thalassovita mediterranea]
MSLSGRANPSKGHTRSKVSAAATQPDALPFGHASLVGTVLTPRGPRAYVHLGQGRIHRVRPGDLLEGATVSAIQNGAIILSRGSDSRRMTLPSG